MERKHARIGHLYEGTLLLNGGLFLPDTPCMRFRSAIPAREARPAWHTIQTVDQADTDLECCDENLLFGSLWRFAYITDEQIPVFHLSPGVPLTGFTLVRVQHEGFVEADDYIYGCHSERWLTTINPRGTRILERLSIEGRSL